MIMLGSKFALKGSLKCSQLGQDWLKNKQISYISPNFGGSGLGSQDWCRIKGACLTSRGWASRAARRVEQQRSIPAVPEIQPLIWAPTPTRNSGRVHPTAPRRHSWRLKDSKGKQKKQAQPPVDDGRVLFLYSLPMLDVVKGMRVLFKSYPLPLKSWLHLGRKWSDHYVLPF